MYGRAAGSCLPMLFKGDRRKALPCTIQQDKSSGILDVKGLLGRAGEGGAVQMKRAKQLRINLAVLVTLVAAYQLAVWVLNQFHLTFMNLVRYPVIAVTGVLFFVFALRTILWLGSMAKEKQRRGVFRFLLGAGSVLLALLLAVMMLYAPMVFAFWHQPEHVVEKDGKKMVAYVNSFLHITINYYDYENIFVRGSRLKLLVDAGKGGYDPFANGGEPDVHRYMYFDDDGNVTDSNWAA